MDQAPSDSTLWNEYRGVIARHIVPGHDVIDTVNRLLRKNPWLRGSGDRFQIKRSGLFITDESWILSRLWRLIHPEQVTPHEPASTTGAVLLLRHDRTDYLMDGRRRINYWHRNAMPGPHRALVLHSDHNGA